MDASENQKSLLPKMFTWTLIYNFYVEVYVCLTFFVSLTI